MSQHADTNEGIGEDDALNEWITQHKLNDAAQKLKIKKITLDELQELSQSFENELRQYAKNELQLDLMSSVRFAKAVKSLAASAVAPPHMSKNETPGKPIKTCNAYDSLENILKANDLYDDLYKILTQGGVDLEMLENEVATNEVDF
eukprot:UN07631